MQNKWLDTGLRRQQGSSQETSAGALVFASTAYAEPSVVIPPPLVLPTSPGSVVSRGDLPFCGNRRAAVGLQDYQNRPQRVERTSPQPFRRKQARVAASSVITAPSRIDAISPFTGKGTVTDTCDRMECRTVCKISTSISSANNFFSSCNVFFSIVRCTRLSHSIFRASAGAPSAVRNSSAAGTP
jgi:hypothetical protein